MKWVSSSSNQLILTCNKKNTIVPLSFCQPLSKPQKEADTDKVTHTICVGPDVSTQQSTGMCSSWTINFILRSAAMPNWYYYLTSLWWSLNELAISVPPIQHNSQRTQLSWWYSYLMSTLLSSKEIFLMPGVRRIFFMLISSWKNSPAPASCEFILSLWKWADETMT